MCSLTLHLYSSLQQIYYSTTWDFYLFFYILEVLPKTRFWAPKRPPGPLTLSTRAILDIDHLKIATFWTYLNNNFIISESTSGKNTKQEPWTRPGGKVTTPATFRVFSDCFRTTLSWAHSKKQETLERKRKSICASMYSPDSVSDCNCAVHETGTNIFSTQAKRSIASGTHEKRFCWGVGVQRKVQSDSVSDCSSWNWNEHLLHASKTLDR